MINISVFASGRGSNFLYIARLLDQEPDLGQIRLLISNNSNAGALISAKEMGIPCYVIRRKDFSAPEDYVNALLEKLKEAETDLIVLAGYMKLIPSRIVREYEKRIMNIHPALLPNFGGKGYYGMKVHEAVIRSGVKITGVTIHFVDEKYDHGPIIAQEPVRVKADDTPESLAKRVLEVEHKLYPAVVKAFCQGKIKFDEQKVIWNEFD